MTTRVRPTSATPLLAALSAAVLLLAACDADAGSGGGEGQAPTDGKSGGGADGGSGEPGQGTGGDMDQDQGDAAVLASLDHEAYVLSADSATELSLEVSRTLFESAPVVVIATEEEQLRAASAGSALRIPVLIDGPEVAAEVNRLDAELVLALGQITPPDVAVAIPADDEQLAGWLGQGTPIVNVPPDNASAMVAGLDPEVPQLLVPHAGSGSGGAAPGDDEGADDSADEASATAAPLRADVDELPTLAAPTAAQSDPASVAMLSTGRAEDLAALGAARGAGIHALVLPHTDPRASSDSVRAFAQANASTWIGLGADFGEAEDLAWQARTATTGVELPGGGQLLFADKMYVALYGTTSTPALGVLGEQQLEETIARAREHASWYEPLVDKTVVPSLEIIVTVAAADATEDGNYSRELPFDEFEELIDLAEEEGAYVVLDLQPGRSDFLTQAKLYEDLLLRPHVGLALDPEWRLGPDGVHLVQIGQVAVDEVNQVVDYLADLTREHDLPQKLLVLHMFQTRMIPHVDEVDQSRSEVAVLIHVDGQGAPGAKHETWRALLDYAPSVEHWGWKNFYDEDVPMLSPEQTIDQVDPEPAFISYQ